MPTPEPLPSAAGSGSSSPLSPQSHRQAAERLAAELSRRFAELDRWLDAPAANWIARAPEGGWSVGEVCEHVALANHYLLLLAQKIADRGARRAARGLAPPAQASDLSILAALGRREFRWSRPDHMAPSGRLERGELRTRLAEQREQCLALATVVGSGAGALHRIRISVAGDHLDLHQMLGFISMHIERHLDQIKRICGRQATGDST
ncbi:MAG TPA: DinB family protein [Planctomycetota bacterium]|nr:DinB family protein [Planctomycetota bacterium]